MSDNNLKDEDIYFEEPQLTKEDKKNALSLFSEGSLSPAFIVIGFILMSIFIGESWVGYVIGNILVFLGYVFSNIWRKD